VIDLCHIRIPFKINLEEKIIFFFNLSKLLNPQEIFSAFMIDRLPLRIYKKFLLNLFGTIPSRTVKWEIILKKIILPG